MSGYNGVSVSAFTSFEVTNTNQLSVKLGAQTLTTTAISESVANGLTVFTVNMPAASAAGVVSGTVGPASNLADTQTFSIQYNAAPVMNNIVPGNGFTTSYSQGCS